MAPNVSAKNSACETDSASHSAGREASSINGIVLALGLQPLGVMIHDLAALGVDSYAKLRLRDEGEGLQAHPVIGARKSADGLPEKKS